ncbi:MAG: hypothetical protein GXO36_01995 [Chloroflexi bacterium]|nr:hypothetical protein [Chloroflexota bacterium]
MPRVRCYYEDCIFLEEGYCSAAVVELDPNEGCMTYKPAGEFLGEEDDLDSGWEDELVEELSDDDDLWDEDEF